MHRTPEKRVKTNSNIELNSKDTLYTEEVVIPDYEKSLAGKLLMKALLELNTEINQAILSL